MSSSGPGELVRIDGRLNAKKYIDILDNIFIPGAHDRFGADSEIRFIQDQCSIHRATIVKEWFEDHPEIELLDWPPKGADLNPIENAWSMLKGELEDTGRCRTQNELFDRATEIWERAAFRTQYWANLVNSVPDRHAARPARQRAHGGST